jgi:urea-proton symporter
MLIPVGVILYTAAGGLKATFMASYVHTSLVMIALLIFTFQIYASNHTNIGSPAAVRTSRHVVAKLPGRDAQALPRRLLSPGPRFSHW